MNEDEIKLKLLANVPVYVEGIGNFQLPTIRRVIEMGEGTYHELLSRLLFSKDQLEDTSAEVNEFSDMQVFATLIHHNPSFSDSVFSSFHVFLDSIPQKLDNGVIYFGDLSEESVLTEEKWEYLKKIARIGNFIAEKKEEEYKAGNERAKKFLEMQKKRRAMIEKLKKKDEKMNLHSILSAVAWRTNGINDLLDLTIYQLYDAYYRLGLIDNYHYTFTGIYTGNIDGSKLKLPDINWANIIKIN